MKDEKSVAFHARFSHDNVPLGPNAPVIMDAVETNVGSSYDRMTGMFTVPVTGTYFINVDHMGAINTYVYMCLMVDDTRVS